MNKKAQIRIGESIAILFIFLIFIGIGFGFYGKIQKSSFSSQQEENVDLQAIGVVQRASFLPELQCSSKNVVVDNCLDILKVEAFDGMIKKNPELATYYYDRFGFSAISVEKIYPNREEWVIYNNTINDSSNIFTPVPISMYDAKTGNYYFGALKIRYYPK